MSIRILKHNGKAITLNGNKVAVYNNTITGGNVTTDGEYTIRTFTKSETLEIKGNPINVEYLIVAGGGGGGGGIMNILVGMCGPGGGGGAGGLVTGTTILNNGSYEITVGNGGKGGIFEYVNISDGWDKCADGTSGQDSSAFNITAKGGGFGAPGHISTSAGYKYSFSGAQGGSGGGSACCGNMTMDAGATSTGGGNSGGGSYGGYHTTQGCSGGGGGAGTSGGTSTSSSPEYGVGGSGLLSSINGTPVYYASGGTALNKIGTMHNESPNTGNGGAGGMNADGGKGGSGIVIIRYKTPS